MEGIEYCEGWNDHNGMGVSVIGAFDSVENRYRVFCKDNFEEFFKLMNERELLIGFNNIGFDNRVLSTIGSIPTESSHYYDILAEIWRIIGRVKGTGLDNICSLNGLGSKSGNGALAPIQWQRERRDWSSNRLLLE